MHQSLALLHSLDIECLGHAKPNPTTGLTPVFGWLQGFVATPQTPKWHFLMVQTRGIQGGVAVLV